MTSVQQFFLQAQLLTQRSLSESDALELDRMSWPDSSWGGGMRERPERRPAACLGKAGGATGLGSSPCSASRQLLRAGRIKVPWWRGPCLPCLRRLR